jgi:hypothetical protein
MIDEIIKHLTCSMSAVVTENDGLSAEEAVNTEGASVAAGSEGLRVTATVLWYIKN